MNAAVFPAEAADLKQRIIQFTRFASTEIATHDEGLIGGLASCLHAGTTVYVAHTPKATLQEIVRVATRLQGAGLRASPHIVARRIRNSRELKNAVAELADYGVDQALVIAGDLDRPAGTYSSAMDVLETGVLVEAGIRNIAVAGHPEGHPAIGPSTLWKTLQQKQALAARSGVRMHVITQFGFDPAAVSEWHRCLGEHGISLPIQVGMAGPAPLPKLIKYAMHCGVGASLRGVMRSMVAMRNVTGLATSADEMVSSLASVFGAARPPTVIGPHLYSFGGAMATARWLRAVMDGNFELSPQGGRLVMTS